MKKTKAELIAIWLAVHPQDASSPDLDFNAVAGYVEMADGTFLQWRDFRALMQGEDL